MLEEVERSYIGLERIAATALSLRDFAQGRLSLGCLPALSQALLPIAARHFMATHPQAGLSITPQESPLLEQWLSEQRFDLLWRAIVIARKFQLLITDSRNFGDGTFKVFLQIIT